MVRLEELCTASLKIIIPVDKKELDSLLKDVDEYGEILVKGYLPKIAIDNALIRGYEVSTKYSRVDTDRKTTKTQVATVISKY